MVVILIVVINRALGYWALWISRFCPLYSFFSLHVLLTNPQAHLPLFSYSFFMIFPYLCLWSLSSLKSFSPYLLVISPLFYFLHLVSSSIMQGLFPLSYYYVLGLNGSIIIQPNLIWFGSDISLVFFSPLQPNPFPYPIQIGLGYQSLCLIRSRFGSGYMLTILPHIIYGYEY